MFARVRGVVYRVRRDPVVSDARWARIQPSMPGIDNQFRRPFLNHHRVIQSIVPRYRAGIPWRDLPNSKRNPLSLLTTRSAGREEV